MRTRRNAELEVNYGEQNASNWWKLRVWIFGEAWSAEKIANEQVYNLRQDVGEYQPYPADSPCNAVMGESAGYGPDIRPYDLGIIRDFA